MIDRQIKRVNRDLTESERIRLRQHQEQTDAHLPDLERRDQMRKEARDEATLSGELRRAVHASGLSLAEIATQVGITPPLAGRLSNWRTYTAVRRAKPFG